MVGTETDMTEHPDDILRALADPDRLRIAGALAAGEAAPAAPADTLDLPLARVRRHLTRLADAGIARLQPDRRTYRLDTETLRWAAEQVGPLRDAGIALGAANEDEEAVPSSEMGASSRYRRSRRSDGSSSSGSPSSSSPGVRYDEREVNAIVGAFFNEHASLRRHLVDEGFLDREAGTYWGTGGRVDV